MQKVKFMNDEFVIEQMGKYISSNDDLTKNSIVNGLFEQFMTYRDISVSELIRNYENDKNALCSIYENHAWFMLILERSKDALELINLSIENADKTDNILLGRLYYKKSIALKT